MKSVALVIMASLCHIRSINALVYKTLWRPILRPYLKPASSLHTTLFRSSTRLFSSQQAHDTNTDHSSINIEIEPDSEQAKRNLSKLYSTLPESISSTTNMDVQKSHASLLKLTSQILSWNERINLISRKQCTAHIVYHNHILPSVALLPILLQNNTNNNIEPLNIIDVGTGGGFPGLPLAITLPNHKFTLVDSIQKKLLAVSEMASDLDVSNVRIHCGRVEEMYADDHGKRQHYKKYDVVLGRSVTALPRFCAWVSNLLKEDGKLVYIIGGEVEDVVSCHVLSDTPLDSLLQREEGTSDKRALVFSAASVRQIAEESGELYNVVRSGGGGSGQKKKKKNDVKMKNQGKRLARGEWSKKRNDVKKDRGYEGFKRYEF